MTNALKAITQADMALINARFAEYDRRLETSASQYSQLSVQLGIMDASVKKIEISIAAVQQKAEIHAESIAKALERIMYALGIDDGKADTAEAVRLTIKGNVKGRAEKHSRIVGIVDDLIKWSIRGIVFFLLGCVLLFAQVKIKEYSSDPKVEVHEVIRTHM